MGEEGGRTLPAAPLTELVVCPPASSLVSWFDPAFFFTLALQYVREEFKAHKEVPPAQADAFMKTWQEYWVHLARSRVRYAGVRVRTVCSRDELPRDGLLGSAVCAWFLRRVLELTGAVVTDFLTAFLVHSVPWVVFPLLAWLIFFFLQGDAIGRDLDKDTTEALSEEQAAKLDELAVAARTVARGGEDDETGAPHDGK